MSLTEMTDYEQSGFVPEILHETDKAKLVQFRKINENRMVLLCFTFVYFTACLEKKETACSYN